MNKELSATMSRRVLLLVTEGRVRWLESHYHPNFQAMVDLRQEEQQLFLLQKLQDQVLESLAL
jgi:hypothetical protein